MNKTYYCDKCKCNRWRMINQNKKECRKCKHIRYEK